MLPGGVTVTCEAGLDLHCDEGIASRGQDNPERDCEQGGFTRNTRLDAKWQNQLIDFPRLQSKLRPYQLNGPSIVPRPQNPQTDFENMVVPTGPRVHHRPNRSTDHSAEIVCRFPHPEILTDHFGDLVRGCHPARINVKTKSPKWAPIKLQTVSPKWYVDGPRPARSTNHFADILQI